MAVAPISAGIEEWRVVPSKPEIEASSWGRIRRKSHIKPMPHGGTREYHSTPNYGVKTRSAKHAAHVYLGYVYRGIGNVKVHRLVCEAFHGSPPFEGAVVIHLNEDALDNQPGNLKWGTQKENLNMPKFLAWKRGLRAYGR